MDRTDERHDSKNGILYKDLVPGRRYRVSWSDCCAEGWFEGVLVEQEEWEIRFDCGAIDTVSDGQTWITGAD
jgi:hypothetical protein